MNMTLLDQFLRQECTPDVRRSLMEAIANEANERPCVVLNRFEITIERADEVVVIEDVLDASDEGAQRLPLSAFVDALRDYPAPH